MKNATVQSVHEISSRRHLTASDYVWSWEVDPVIEDQVLSHESADDLPLADIWSDLPPLVQVYLNLHAEGVYE